MKRRGLPTALAEYVTPGSLLVEFERVFTGPLSLFSFDRSHFRIKGVEHLPCPHELVSFDDGHSTINDATLFFTTTLRFPHCCQPKSAVPQQFARLMCHALGTAAVRAACREASLTVQPMKPTGSNPKEFLIPNAAPLSVKLDVVIVESQFVTWRVFFASAPFRFATHATFVGDIVAPPR